MLDCVITGGLLVDGTGRPAVRADIGVRDGRVVAIGKGFGNGFPVTCVAVREPFKESFEKISASSSYGGNPMACAAALASTEVIEEENLLERSTHLGELALKRMNRMKSEHKIVGVTNEDYIALRHFPDLRVRFHTPATSRHPLRVKPYA